MSYLVDSNLLLRLIQPSDPNHAIARSALRILRARGEVLYVLPQNVAEFWNVCTRPTTARGGLGMTTAEAEMKTRLVERLFTVLPDAPGIYAEWRRLVVNHAVQGVQVHDARIAAAMHIHGVPRILTFNDGDFARYSTVTAIHPSSIT